MRSSPLSSVLFITGGLLLPPAVAGPSVPDVLTITGVISREATSGAWDLLRRALLAPTAPAADRQASFDADAVSIPLRDPASAGHGSARSRAAPAGEEVCAMSGVMPGARLALRVVAHQFGAPVTQLLDEYQAYRSSWQGRD